jgi:hypothetical protein
MRKLLSFLLLGAFLASVGCTSNTSAPPKPATPPPPPKDGGKAP